MQTREGKHFPEMPLFRPGFSLKLCNPTPFLYKILFVCRLWVSAEEVTWLSKTPSVSFLGWRVRKKKSIRLKQALPGGHFCAFMR